MALLLSVLLFLPLISLFSGDIAVSVSAAAPAAERKNYIVHMNAAKKPTTHLTHQDWYRHTLASISVDPDIHLLYTYSTALHGFSASLLPHHLPLLRRHPALLHLHPDPLLRLHTTRSPLFLGLLPSSPTRTPLTQAASTANDVIIGVLDTGVWPESPSFSDAGLPPIPARWRGECEAGVDFPPSLCNRKLIGARSFDRGFHGGATGAAHEYASPRDRDGHGTHTASTAAGAPAANASLLGYAAGTARGMAVAARIAAYKVCWSSGCFGSDILAGMDAALADGVDVLSLSLGGGSAPYFRDTIAVGAFAAAERGVFVACSAGNSGPRRATLANAAPWIATVGAGTLDRDFPAYAALAGGQRKERHTGVSLYSGQGMGTKKVPLLYGPTAGRGGNGTQMCLAGTLDPARVKGKVVLCDRGISARVEKGAVVKSAGGVGMILANTAANGEELVADSHLLPAVAVGSIDGDRIRMYAVRNRRATAVLSFGGTVVGVRPSPVVAAFSSRGPNLVTPTILKPDLIGPGINILAGWSGSVGPTGLAMDTRRTDFNIMSGTSMSCPHISGLAALLKAAHPGWSPSAIKSALMTTAYTLDNTGSPLRDAAGGSLATPLAYGAGHVDPEKALSPGLIYDITTDDYITFLCSLNYTIEHIQAIAKRPNINCSRRLSDPGNLNYPSFSVVFEKSRRMVKYRRELTNVGNAKSVYSLKLGGTENVSVSVKPKKLVFKQVGQKLKYTITFASKKGVNPMDVQFGWISWSNKENQVRSPIAYTWKMA